MLFFVVPHQFLSKILNQLKELKGDKNECRYFLNSVISSVHLTVVVDSSAVGISLIKGVRFVDEMNSEGVPLQLLSANIQSQLNLSSVAVLMGANVAADVAQDKVIIYEVVVLHGGVCSIPLEVYSSSHMRPYTCQSCVTVRGGHRGLSGRECGETYCGIAGVS